MSEMWVFRGRVFGIESIWHRHRFRIGVGMQIDFYDCNVRVCVQVWGWTLTAWGEW